MAADAYHPPRPRAHDDDPAGQEQRFLDIMRDEHGPRAKTARIRQRALAAAFARLEAAEKIAAELQTRRDDVAAARMTPEASAQLQRLEQALAEAKAADTAGAAVLKVDLLQLAPQVRLNGAVVEGSARVFVTDTQTLEFDGIGSVAVLPPASGAPAQARLRAAEQDLAAFRSGGHRDDRSR